MLGDTVEIVESDTETGVVMFAEMMHDVTVPPQPTSGATCHMVLAEIILNISMNPSQAWKLLTIVE